MGRGARILAGLVLLGLGLGSVNYARPGNREHHEAWAAEEGLPAPSDAILYGGGGVGLLGLLVLVSGLRRRSG